MRSPLSLSTTTDRAWIVDIGQEVPRTVGRRQGMWPVKQERVSDQLDESTERCRSGRTGLTRNQVYPCGYPGFESLPLRQRCQKTPRAPLGPLAFWVQGWARVRIHVAATPRHPSRIELSRLDSRAAFFNGASWRFMALHNASAWCLDCGRGKVGAVGMPGCPEASRAGGIHGFGSRGPVDS